MDKNQPSHYEYDKYIEKLEQALKEIRDSTFRSALTLRDMAARALEHGKRPY